MSAPSPLSTLSGAFEDCRQGHGHDGSRRQQNSPEFAGDAVGALKIADKVTVTIEGVGNKIRLNSQGWEDLRNERQVFMVVALKGQLYLLPEHRPAKFERIDHDGLAEAGYGPDDFECVTHYAATASAEMRRK
jgi:hypothetical protein